MESFCPKQIKGCPQFFVPSQTFEKNAADYSDVALSQEPKATNGRSVTAFKVSCPAGKSPFGSFLA